MSRRALSGKIDLRDAAFCRRIAHDLERMADRIESQFPTCPICWHRFRPSNPQQLYCSAKCRFQAKRRRYDTKKGNCEKDSTASGTAAGLLSDAS